MSEEVLLQVKRSLEVKEFVVGASLMIRAAPLMQRASFLTQLGSRQVVNRGVMQEALTSLHVFQHFDGLWLQRNLSSNRDDGYEIGGFEKMRPDPKS